LKKTRIAQPTNKLREDSINCELSARMARMNSPQLLRQRLDDRREYLRRFAPFAAGADVVLFDAARLHQIIEIRGAG
jgi:hypothetical protein